MVSLTWNGTATSYSAYGTSNHTMTSYGTTVPGWIEEEDSTTTSTHEEELADSNELDSVYTIIRFPSFRYSPAEEAKLVRLVQADLSWKQIQEEHFPTRSAKNLKLKYLKMAREACSPWQYRARQRQSYFTPEYLAATGGYHVDARSVTNTSHQIHEGEEYFSSVPVPFTNGMETDISDQTWQGESGSRAIVPPPNLNKCPPHHGSLPCRPLVQHVEGVKTNIGEQTQTKSKKQSTTSPNPSKSSETAANLQSLATAPVHYVDAVIETDGGAQVEHAYNDKAAPVKLSKFPKQPGDSGGLKAATKTKTKISGQVEAKSRRKAASFPKLSKLSKQAGKLAGASTEKECDLSLPAEGNKKSTWFETLPDGSLEQTWHRQNARSTPLSGTRSHPYTVEDDKVSEPVSNYKTSTLKQTWDQKESHSASAARKDIYAPPEDESTERMPKKAIPPLKRVGQTQASRPAPIAVESPYTSKEDNMIFTMVGAGATAEQIAAQIKPRTVLSIQLRINTLLKIQCLPYTAEEDDKIFTLRTAGASPVEIASTMQGRTAWSIQVRFNELVKAQKAKGVTEIPRNGQPNWSIPLQVIGTSPHSDAGPSCPVTAAPSMIRENAESRVFNNAAQRPTSSTAIESSVGGLNGYVVTSAQQPRSSASSTSSFMDVDTDNIPAMVEAARAACAAAQPISPSTNWNQVDSELYKYGLTRHYKQQQTTPPVPQNLTPQRLTTPNPTGRISITPPTPQTWSQQTTPPVQQQQAAPPTSQNWSTQAIQPVPQNWTTPDWSMKDTQTCLTARDSDYLFAATGGMDIDYGFDLNLGNLDWNMTGGMTFPMFGDQWYGNTNMGMTTGMNTRTLVGSNMNMDAGSSMFSNMDMNMNINAGTVVW